MYRRISFDIKVINLKMAINKLQSMRDNLIKPNCNEFRADILHPENIKFDIMLLLFNEYITVL